MAGTSAITVGIHVEPFGELSEFLLKYENILTHNGVNSRRVDSNSSDFWDVVKGLQLFIYRWRHYDVERQRALAILPIVQEELGIPCFPDLKTCWHYDDKIREYLLMRAHGHPMGRCWVFWEEEPAISWARDAELPLVFKLTGGAGSTNVILVRDRKQLVRLIRTMFGKGCRSGKISAPGSLRKTLLDNARRWMYLRKLAVQGQVADFPRYLPDWQIHKNYVLFQEFLPGNDYDTRVTVIGGRAFGFRRFNRPSDFRSSGSGLIDHTPAGIDSRFVKIALDVSRDMGFQSMAYDFLWDRNGAPSFCEISYTYQDRAVQQCEGYWDENLEWHAGHYWPQYWHLYDALGLPELVQPPKLT